jgi:uncharacterized membrane protein
MGALFGQLEIARPLWLALLLVLLPVIYYWRRSLMRLAPWQRAASLVLCAAAIALVAAAACGIKFAGHTSQQYVVFAVDRSQSIGDEARGTADEFIRQATQHAGADRTATLPFAGRAGEAVSGATGPADETTLQPARTDIAAAIAAARAAIPSQCVGQIVLLTDGNASEGGAVAAAQAAGVRISVVPLPGCPKQEVYVAAVTAPGIVRPGESFPVEVHVQSTHDDEGTVELLQGEKVMFKQRQKIVRGENRLRFRQSVSGSPLVALTARISGFRDAEKANNAAAAAVCVARRPRVLLVEMGTVPVFAPGTVPVFTPGTVPVFVPAKTGLSPSGNSGLSPYESALKTALQDGQIGVDVLPAEKMPRRIEELRPYDVLILSNVPAAALNDGRMELLAPYVRDFGGGLVLIGGDQSFTPGGYRGTPLEEVLPLVSHERKDKPKPGLAQVLVLDCSISMQGESIELARQATRRAVENLGPNDQVGILAFEDQNQWITPLRRCSDADKQQVLKQIDSIAVGGRTNMHPAMDRAFLALHEADAELKHILVMTDGISDPDDFAGLTRRIAADGITVSTVGVGPQVAREFLAGIAKTGRGRSYFCKTAADVPQVFALETISAGKVGITEEPFEPKVEQSAAAAAAAAEFFADFDLAQAPRLLGYAETRAKPGSHVLMAAAAGDPLLAWHRCGRGTCVAFASDVQSRWAAAWIERPEFFAPFWCQVVRQAMPPIESGELALRLAHEHGRGLAVLDAADSAGRFRNDLQPGLKLVDPAQRSRTVAMTQVAPGRYAAEFDAAAPGTYAVEADVGGTSSSAQTIRRGLAVGYADELRFRPTDTELLRSIARQSGGQYEPDAAAVFTPSDRTVPRTIFFWPYLLAAGLLLFVGELALRRMVR